MYSHNFKTLWGNNSQLNWYTCCMRKEQRCWSNISGVRVSGWSLASCQPDIIRLVFSVASRPQKPLGKGTTGHLPLLSHSSRVLSSHFSVVSRSQKPLGKGTTGHLFFHTAPELCPPTSVLIYVHRDCKGRGPQVTYLFFHTAPGFCPPTSVLLYVHRDCKGRGPQVTCLFFTQFRPVAFRPQRPW